MKRGIPDAEVVEATDTKLSGEPARRVVIAGHAVNDKRDVRAIVIICVRNRQVYSLGLSGNATSVGKCEKQFDELAASFKFLKA